MKLARLLAIAISMNALMLTARVPAYAQAAPAASSSPALPQGWDPKIPLPPGVALVDSSVPKTGVVYSADFKVKGDYKELVNFYETELPKAGFMMSSKVAFPARKVYNRNFATGGRLDSVVITPMPNDPSSFDIHVAWSPEPAASKSATH